MKKELLTYVKRVFYVTMMMLAFSQTSYGQDTTPPTITSGNVAASIDENSGANQLIYTTTATDNVAVTGYVFGGVDNAAFSFNTTSGEVNLIANPDFETKPSYSFTVTAKDAAGNTSSVETVTLSINNLDEEQPIITSSGSATSIDENSGAGQVIYTVVASDDIGVTNYAFGGGTDDSSFTINATNGQVTLTANPDFETKNNYIFKVVVSDAAGNTSFPRTVSLSINDLEEERPVITSGDTATAIDENTGAPQVIYTITATDNVAVTSYEFAGGADDASFRINAPSGRVRIINNPDFETKSSYSFAVRAKDAAGNLSLIKTVTLAINDLDDADPVITSATTADPINENTGAMQMVYTVTATDDHTAPNGLAASPYSIGGTDAAAFTINATTGVVTLTANPDFETKDSYSFDVSATDTAGNVATQTVTLIIFDVEEVPPTITSGITATAIDENSGAAQVIYTIAATDNTINGVTYGLTGNGTDDAEFTVNSATGEVTLTDDPDFETQATYSFEVSATDAALNEATQTVTLAINDLDEVKPVITSGDTATSINENSGTNQSIYTITATDNIAPVTYGVQGVDGASFTVGTNNGIVKLIDNPDYEAKSTYTFDVIATDAAGNISDPKTVTLTIIDVEEVNPQITSGDTATAIDENSGAGQMIYNVTATDNVGVVGYQLSGGTDDASFSINAATGDVTLTANPNFETKSSYSFGVTATDADGNVSDVKTVTLAINDLDEVNPTITSATTANAINENTGANQVIYTVTATDSHSGVNGLAAAPYAFAGGTDDALFTINSTTGAVTLTANPDFETKSSYSFDVSASDLEGNMDTQTVTLIIFDVEEVLPTITSATVATAINENSGAAQVIYTVAATDNTPSAITYGLTGNGADDASFTIDAGTGEVTLTGNPDFETQAAYSFEVSATDAALNEATQTVTLAINDLDETAPTITSAATATDLIENTGAGQVIYTVMANDVDDSAVATVLTNPYALTGNGADDSHFTINAATGDVTLTANPDYETKVNYSFEVSATDAAGNATTLTVTFRIFDVEELQPQITSGDTATAIDENSGAAQVIYTVTATDNVAVVSYQLSGGTDDALFTIDAMTGAVTLTADPNFEAKASYSFGVTATDGEGNVSDVKTVTLAINDLDEANPTITSAVTATGINENTGAGQVIYTVTATDTHSGVNGLAATPYAFAGGTDDALFTINSSTGAVSLTANPDFETKSSYSFDVSATDLAGNSDTQTVTLDIFDVEEIDPTITSVATATAIDENSGAAQVIYTVTATDNAPGTITYELTGAGTDDAKFSIDSVSGEVTLTADPDFETQASYSFDVSATDVALNKATKTVILAINDLDEIDPTITSATTANASPLAENSGAGQVIHRVTATDSHAGVNGLATNPYALTGGVDDALFTINTATGRITLIANPDFETKSSYSFGVSVTDAAGNTATQTISLEITNTDDAIPVITSGNTATINENSGANQLVYNITATDDIGVTSYSIGGTDSSEFSLNASTGAVYLIANPDFETKATYTFEVTANDAVANASDIIVVTLTVNNILEISDIVAMSSNPAADGTPAIADLVTVGVINTIDDPAYQVAYEEAIADANPAPTTLAELQAIIDAVNTLSTTSFDQASFKVYPNPVTSEVNIQLSGDSKNLEVTVYDLSGRAVYQGVPNVKNNNTFSLNLSRLNAGIYIMNIKNDNSVVTKRIVKE